MELIQSRETRRGMARQRPGRPAGGPGRGDCADGWDEEVAEPAIKPGSVVDSHSSGTCVTAGLKQPTRVRHEPCHSTPIWSCSGWGLPCPGALSPRAVGSYPTVSPLPRTLAGRSAVCFLLHFPSAHAAQALPGTLLCGARTFLGALLRRDCLGRLRRGGLSHSGPPPAQRLAVPEKRPRRSLRLNSKTKARRRGTVLRTTPSPMQS